MDRLWDVLFLAFAPLLLFLLHACYYLSSKPTNNARLPPGPPAWPIIGSLHLLIKFPHQTFARLSCQYGPLLYLRLGSMHAVVVSNATLAKQVLLTNDKSFANRPNFEMCKRMLYGYDSGVVFTSYGPHWREMRKMCTLELFTTRRLQEFQHARMEEIAVMLQGLENQSQEGRLSIDIGKFMGTLASNIMGRLLLSKRLSESTSGGASLQQLFEEMVSAFATPVVGDFIPYLGWLDLKSKRLMDRLHSRIDKTLEAILTERQRDREKCPMDAPMDFLDVLLSSSNASSEAARLSKQTIKAVMLDILGAGIETSATTVEWAMAELLHSPLTLNKVRDELDTVVGRSRRVAESDLPHLTYLKAVIKETFRLHPPAPLLVPRASSEACKVAGFVLPENTRLFVNVWAIGRDPEIWEKPEEFWPERFKELNIDLRGQHFELLPFGSGRRICPGMPLGLSVVELTICNLVHSFDWELPNGQTPKNVDMKETDGITVRKAEPLIAIPKLRLARGN